MHDHILKQRREEGTYRFLRDTDSLIDFCSNDYLGIATEQLLIPHLLNNIGTTPFLTGSSGSRLISGNHSLHEKVERELADFYGKESALLFNSGFDANTAFFSAVPQKGDLILYDEYVHASILDGIKLSRAEAVSFRHNDLQDAATKCLPAFRSIYLTTETLYSMDGDTTDLQGLVALKGYHPDIRLITDEAHANGFYGQKGEGRVVEAGCMDSFFAVTVTFSKGFGCHGAAIVCSATIKDFLINYGRPFIYSTALPNFNVLAIEHALQLMPAISDRRAKVFSLANQFVKKLPDALQSNVVAGTVNSPIVSLMLGQEKSVSLSAYLLEKGIYAKAIVYPTVAKGKERIRFSFHAHNTDEQVDLLSESIHQWSTSVSF